MFLPLNFPLEYWFEHATLNVLPFMSCLDSLPGQSTWDPQVLQLIVPAVFGAVD